MIALSTQPVRFTPSFLARQGDPPAYFLRPGNVIEREMFEAELAGDYRAGRVWDFELMEAFTGGVRVLLADDPEAEALIELAQAEVTGDPIDDAGRQRLAAAKEIMAEHWPDYRHLIAQAARRQTIIPLLAFRRFCVGWEGPATTFRRSPDGLVHLEAVAGIPRYEMRAAGIHAYELLNAGHQAGNSAAPSPSDEGQQIMSSDAPSPAAAG